MEQMTVGQHLVTHLSSRFTEAVSYACIVHGDQLRKGTSIPYLAHPLGVASLALEAGGDEELAIAALLHDAAEDRGGQPRLDDIRARFGDRVAGVVAGCTDTLSGTTSSASQPSPTATPLPCW